MRAWWLVALGIAAAGCEDGMPWDGEGGEAREERGERGKPEGARVAGYEDLAVRVRGPTPVGRVVPDLAREYPLEIDVVNTSDRTLRLRSPHLVVTVQRDGQPLAACEEPVLKRVPAGALSPGERRTVHMGLPCGLEPGDHRVVATLVFGNPRSAGAATAAGPTAALDLDVDDDRQWFIGEDPPQGRRRAPR
jgi:hypothetical protein